MKQTMPKILVTHANLDKQLTILVQAIAGYHYSDSSKSTHIYTHAGIFPAKESPEQVAELLDNINNNNNQEVKENG